MKGIPTIEARYEGWCAGCGEPIEPGQIIKADDSGIAGAWMHDSCEDVSEPPLDRRPRCPFCADLKAADGSCGCSE